MRERYKIILYKVGVLYEDNRMYHAFENISYFVIKRVR